MGRPSLSKFPDNPDPLDIAWAAGLFEGEGCASFNRKNGKVELVMQMTDLDVLEKFCRVVGGQPPRLVNRTSTQICANPKPIYRWAASSEQYVQTFIKQLGPWLSSRRLAQLNT